MIDNVYIYHWNSINGFVSKSLIYGADLA